MRPKVSFGDTGPLAVLPSFQLAYGPTFGRISSRAGADGLLISP